MPRSHSRSRSRSRRAATTRSVVITAVALTAAAPAVLLLAAPLRAAAQETGAALVPAPASSFVLSVLAPDGKPAAGARVFSVPVANPYTVPDEAATDAQGRVTLSGERLVFVAAVAGSVPGLDVIIAGEKEGPRTLRLLAADAAGNTGKGRVTDETGKPLAGVGVAGTSVMRMMGDGSEAKPYRSIVAPLPVPFAARLRATTAADGSFTLSGMPSGPGVLIVAVTDTRYGGARDGFLLSGVPLTVTSVSGKNVQTLGGAASADAPKTLVARPGGSLAGRVVYAATGKPAAGVRVSAEGVVSGITGQEGTYTLLGIPAGPVSVTVDDPTGQTVAVAAEGVRVVPGKATPVPPLTLSAGGFVAGRVLDADTKEPLSGVHIGVIGPHGSSVDGGMRSATTGPDGTYRARVPAGTTRVYVMGKPRGYVYEQALLPVTVRAGETRTQDIPLKKGLSVSGVLVDEAGKPVVNTTVRAFRDVDSFDRTVTDAEGRFTLIGLPTGFVVLELGDVFFGGTGGDQSGKFTLGGDANLTLPRPAAAAPLRLVRKAAAPELRLTGRVIDPQGTPVPGATVTGDVAIMRGQSGFGMNLKPATTDADGRYTLGPFPAIGVFYQLKAEKAGWVYRSGGKVSESKAARGTAATEPPMATDFVLVRLSGRVSGAVVNAAGKPVAGARVLSLTGGGKGSEALTDTAGRFTLSDLPEGKVKLLAGKPGAGLANAAPSTGGPAPVLTLEAIPPAPAADLDRAARLVEAALSEGANKTLNERTELSRVLAPYDPDRAEAALKTGGGNVPSWILRSLYDAVIDALPPARAAEWTLPRIASLMRASDRVGATLHLSRALEKSDPMKARELYRKARADADAHAGEVDHYDRAKLAASAARLGDSAQASRDVDAALELVATKAPQDQADGIRGAMGEYLAERGALLLAEKVAAVITSEKERSLGYARLIVGAAKDSPAGAQRILAQAEARGVFGVGHEADFRIARARAAVASALAAREPEAALTLARGIGDKHEKGRALLAVARHLPKTRAAAVYREAVTLLPPPYDEVERIARASRDAAALDPALGRELMAAARSLADDLTRSDFRRGTVRTQMGLISWAFYAAPTAPEEARLTLERAWSVATAAPEGYERAEALGRIVRAMAAVDTERAIDLAATLPAGSARWSAQGWLARWAAAPPEARRAMTLEQE